MAIFCPISPRNWEMTQNDPQGLTCHKKELKQSYNFRIFMVNVGDLFFTKNSGHFNNSCRLFKVWDKFYKGFTLVMLNKLRCHAIS